MSDNEPQPNSTDRPAGVASACANDESEPPQGGYQPIDTHNALSGRDLRYVLTSYIDAGYSTVKTLVRKLAEDGYTVWGRASKVVSDALDGKSETVGSDGFVAGCTASTRCREALATGFGLEPEIFSF